MANNQIGWDSDTKMLNSINKQLDKLITTVYSSSTSAAQSALEAEAAATLSTEQATLSASARNDAEAARLGAENAEDNALISAIGASNSANNGLASEQASEAIFTNTQSLLLNFFDDAIIALNSRIVADGGIVVIKLRFVQQELDEIYAL